MALQAIPKYELDGSNLCLALFCLIISVVFVFILKRRSKPNLPPSPPKLPFIGNLHQLGTETHRSFTALSQKYGPLMLLHLGQRPTLVVSSVVFIRDIVKAHDIVFSSRPQTTAAKILFYGYKDLGFAPYGEDWRQKKKICVLELLSLKSVRSFHLIREEEAAELINNICKACFSNGCSVNLSEMLIATSNNIVSRCILGYKYDTQDGIYSSFGELARKVMLQLVSFCVGDFFPSLGWIDVLTGLIPKFKATFRALDAFFDQVIAERKKVKKKGDGDDSHHNDFVDILLQLQQDGMAELELTRDTLKGIIMDMFVGGSDTTSTAMEWAFAELMKNPTIMKKAQDEVRRVVGNKARVEENDVNEMNYLKCVVKETLRLHPPVPLLVPRETSSSVKLGGYDIPAKTMVYINAWAIQRDPELWDRPEEFLPERFENLEVDFKGQDFLLIPFGAGRRKCPGISFAVASAEYVLANLLYWFDWKLPRNVDSVEDLDMSEICGLTVNKKVPLHLEAVPHTFGSET